MNSIETELKEFQIMVDYFVNNFDNLPFAVQVSYLSALSKFIENIKPIYLTAITIIGGKENEEN